MMKRVLLAAIVLLISAFALCAAEADVTWVWFENDPNVQFYRYQIDGEDDDNWTVVDFFVTEVTVTLDVAELHTLYLQQSYDGIHWSASSFTESEVYPEYEEEEENFFDDDFFFDEPEPEVIIETPAEEDDVVYEATVIEDDVILPEVEVEKYEPQVCLDIGLGYLNSIPDLAGSKALGLNVAYSYTFLKAGIFDIGLKIDAGVYTWRNWMFHTYGNVLALATVKIGNCDLYGAAGPDAFAVLGKNGDQSAAAGLAVELGVRYHRFEKISIGFAVTDHQSLIAVHRGLKLGRDLSNRLELKAFMGISFD